MKRVVYFLKSVAKNDSSLPPYSSINTRQTPPPRIPPKIGATQNSHNCCSAQPPTNTAGPVLRAGFTERLVTGIPIKYERESESNGDGSKSGRCPLICRTHNDKEEGKRQHHLRQEFRPNRVSDWPSARRIHSMQTRPVNRSPLFRWHLRRPSPLAAALRDRRSNHSPRIAFPPTIQNSQPDSGGSRKCGRLHKPSLAPLSQTPAPPR